MFTEDWVIVVNIVTELVSLFMPGAVKWLNDASEIVPVRLIMPITVIMSECSVVRSMNVKVIPINMVVLLMVVVVMIMVQFMRMMSVVLFVMAAFVPVSV